MAEAMASLVRADSPGMVKTHTEGAPPALMAGELRAATLDGQSSHTCSQRNAIVRFLDETS